MSGGYGMRDASMLVNAIGDYAKYTENKRRYDQEYEQQKQRLSIADQRYTEEQAYNREWNKTGRENTLSQQTFENNLKTKDQSIQDAQENDRSTIFDRNEKQIATAEKIRMANSNLVRDNTDSQEQSDVNRVNTDVAAEKNQVGIDKMWQVLSYGKSGNGVGLVTDKDPNDPDGVLTIFNVDKFGNRKPLNVDPMNDDSPAMKFRAENADMLQGHLAKMSEGFTGTDKDMAAYLRAGVTTDEMGLVRPSTAEEFEKRITATKWLALGGDEVALEAILNDKATPDVSPYGSDKTLMARERTVTKQKAQASLDKIKAIRQEVIKDASKKDKIDAFVKEKGALDGLMKNGEVDMSAGFGKLTPKAARIAEISDPVAKVDAIRKEYDSKRKQRELILQTYENNGYDPTDAAENERMMRNAISTGDPRYSTDDLSRQATADNHTLIKMDNLLSDTQLKRAQIEAARAKGPAELKTVQESQFKTFVSGIKDVAGNIGDQLSMDPKMRDAISAKAQMAGEQMIAALGMGYVDLGDPIKRVAFNDSLSSYMRYMQNNPDMTSTSPVGFFTTVIADYKPMVADSIMSISKATGTSQEAMTRTFNDAYDKLRVASNDKNGRQPTEEEIRKLLTVLSERSLGQ